MKRRVFSALLAAALAAFSIGTIAVARADAAVITVVLLEVPRVVPLVVQVKRTTVLRFDRPIQTVAAGSPGVVKVDVVGPQGQARDLLLTALATSGSTDMTVWVGEPGDTTITLWEIVIGARNSASLVFVTSPPPLPRQAAAAVQPAPKPTPQPASAGPQAVPAPAAPQAAPAPPASPATPMPQPTPQPSPSAPPPTATVPAPTHLPPPPPVTVPAGASHLTVQAEQDGLMMIFQVIRTNEGAALRYRLENRSERVHHVVPSRIALWANRRGIAYALVRTTTNPESLLPGGHESGIIVVPGDVREIRIILPIFAVGSKLPVVFEATFTGIERLAVVAP